MTTLREATKKRIFDSLEQTHFTAGCFSVTFAEDKNPFVNIAFIPDKKFSFTIGEPTRFNSSGYISEEAPGRHIESGEEYKHDDLDSCIKAITPWVGRIIEDYRLKNPVMDEFETFRKTLADQFEQHVQDKFAHFTFDEADALRRKLDDLATRLQEVDEKTNNMNVA